MRPGNRLTEIMTMHFSLSCIQRKRTCVRTEQCAARSSGSLGKDDCFDGWWNGFIGPSKSVDTNRYFVICANYLGGCYASTGPSSINPYTKNPYASSFPAISLSDVVDSQTRLPEALCIEHIHAAMDGLLALNLATRYSGLVTRVIPFGCVQEIDTRQRLSNLEQIWA